MRTLRTLITGLGSTAFILAASFNNLPQLTYNADAFVNQPVKFETRLVQMHTTNDGKFFQTAHDRNKIELNKLFNMVRS